MAVEIEAPGQLQEFLEILKKRRWQVILPAAFILALGSAFAVLVPKKYIVETQVELRATVLEDLDGRSSPLSSQTREAQNAALHIRAPNRVRKVIEDLKWTDYLVLSPAEQSNLVREVSRNIDVTLPRARSEGVSTFVTIEYRDVDPQRAVQFLERLRDDWTRNEVDRGRRAVEAERAALQRRGAELAVQARAKQGELSELQSVHGLSPTQPVPGREASRDEDPLYTSFRNRLAERERLGDRLAEAEAQLTALGRQLAGVEPLVQETVVTGGIDHGQRISELELQIATLERRRESYRQGTTRQQLTHQIKQTQATLQAVRDQERRAEERRDWVENPVYAELQSRVALHELERSRVTALLTTLEREVSLLQDDLRERNEVYASVNRIHDELNRLRAAQEDLAVQEARNRRVWELLFGPAGDPFQVIAPVAVPTAPSEPNPWLIVAFALVGGVGAGLGIAVLAEYSKSCFRGAADISRVMVVPVLGIVNTIRTRREVRRERLRRLAVGLSTGLLIGSLAFVTWAWAANPDLLSPWLREQIEEFRRIFA
jgi:polysaccharide biosynthesis transport protein